MLRAIGLVTTRAAALEAVTESVLAVLLRLDFMAADIVIGYPTLDRKLEMLASVVALRLPTEARDSWLRVISEARTANRERNDIVHAVLGVGDPGVTAGLKLGTKKKVLPPIDAAKLTSLAGRLGDALTGLVTMLLKDDLETALKLGFRPNVQPDDVGQ